MRIRLRVVGGLKVGGVSERALGSRKARTLLKVLTLGRGAPVPVDRIADVLWDDEQPARPTDQVGVLVSRLRGVLGAYRIERTEAGYVLHADWLDADELVRLGAAAAEALADGRIGPARAAAVAALHLLLGAASREPAVRHGYPAGNLAGQTWHPHHLAELPPHTSNGVYVDSEAFIDGLESSRHERPGSSLTGCCCHDSISGYWF